MTQRKNRWCFRSAVAKRFTYSFIFTASKGNFYDIKRFAMIHHKLFRVLSSDGYWPLDGGGLQASWLTSRFESAATAKWQQRSIFSIP